MLQLRTHPESTRSVWVQTRPSLRCEPKTRGRPHVATLPARSDDALNWEERRGYVSKVVATCKMLKIQIDAADAKGYWWANPALF